MEQEIITLVSGTSNRESSFLLSVPLYHKVKSQTAVKLKHAMSICMHPKSGLSFFYMFENTHAVVGKNEEDTRLDF